EAERREGARSPPDCESIAVFPDAEMNAGSLDGGSELCQDRGIERQRPLDVERRAAGFAREVGERDRRGATLFTSQTGPEGGVDDALDGRGIGDLGLDPSARHVVAEVLGDRVRDRVGGWIGLAVHAESYCVYGSSVRRRFFRRLLFDVVLK